LGQDLDAHPVPGRRLTSAFPDGPWFSYGTVRVAGDQVHSSLSETTLLALRHFGRRLVTWPVRLFGATASPLASEGPPRPE
jgi:hypothetical protein